MDDNIARVQYRMPKFEFEALLGNRSFEECIHRQMAHQLAEVVEEKLMLKTDLVPAYGFNYDDMIFGPHVVFKGDLAILSVERYEELLNAERCMKGVTGYIDDKWS